MPGKHVQQHLSPRSGGFRSFVTRVSQVCFVCILARERILCIRRLQKLCQGQKGTPHHPRVYLDTAQWTPFNFQVTGPLLFVQS